jgi:hypothetical protein
MHEVDVDERIRDLCRQIIEEHEPSKVEELLSSLHSTVQSYQDETRTRMRYIANYYRDRLRMNSDGADSGSERGARIRALLEFLGLGRGATREGEAES